MSFGMKAAVAYLLIGAICGGAGLMSGLLENACACAAHRRGQPLVVWMLIAGFLWVQMTWPARMMAFVKGMLRGWR